MNLRSTIKFLPALLLGLLISPTTASAQSRVNRPATPSCYVAFIHGSGSEFEGLSGWDDRVRGYWSPNIENNSVTLTAQAAGADEYFWCAQRIVAYDGTREWWAGAKSVARQINEFIDEWGIKDGRLVIVTHSMGGLVARWILNNGELNSPYYNYDGADYDRIRRKTHHAITIQAPHFGSEAADAVYGEAHTLQGSVLGQTLDWLGVQDETPARYTMRRSYMQSATAWMGDSGRGTMLWTIAGNSTKGSNSETLADAFGSKDWELHYASVSLDLSPTFENDGLVERRSAHGFSIAKERTWYLLSFQYSSNQAMQGSFTTWLDTPLNHNHGRYSDIDSVFNDTRDENEFERMRLGQKIYRHGLDLPCSDPHTGPYFFECR